MKFSTSYSFAMAMLWFWNNIPGANKSLLLDIRGPEAVAEAVAADEDVGPVEDLAAADVPAIDEVYAVWKIAPAK